jgi:hypothetical protein
MYNAYVTRIKNLRKHPNADRLQLGECFGNTVCVSLEYVDNQLGVYFPCDGQLSVEFAEANNLLRKKDDAGNNCGGYMDPNKRNVTAIRLRGEKSDGLFLPLTCLETFGNVSTLKEGDVINTFNGHEICCKYIPRRNHRQGRVSDGNRTRKKKVDVAPLFAEHADTEQLAYNLGAFKPGDEIEITLKMHGTSQRTGYLPVFKGYKRTFKDWLLRRDGKPIYDWGYVSGTRRTVLDNYDGGYYGSNEFREQHSKTFEGKLWKGETVYYEVVGFTHTGAPIMAEGNNEKLGKDFVKQYGKTTVFSYGCDPEGESFKHEYADCWDGMNVREFKPQSDIYVYRMTMTNEDGAVVEYTPDFMRYRCEQMGVKTVPVMWKGIIPAHTGDAAAIRLGQGAGAWIKEKAEQYYDGPDPIGKTHVREGVVVRILNRPKFTAYKHKNHNFKMISGIIVDEIADSNVEISDEILAEL